MEDLPNQEQPNLVPQQEPELGGRARADEPDGAMKLALRAKRWGVVNAALCGLLVVGIVGSVLLGLFGTGDAGWGTAIMLHFCVPGASIPFGISCLVGAVWSGVAMRRHPSREARIGLWLSLGGPIAVILCYALAWGILSL